MPQLSIELTDDEQRRLEVRATQAGRSLNDYVRSLALADAPDDEALSELAELMRARIARADQGGASSQSIGDVARMARAKRAG